MALYKGHSIWDEEEDRHFTDAHNKDKEAPDYHRQDDYNAHGGGQSDVYSSQKTKEDEKKEATGIERQVEKEEKKYQKNEQLDDAQIKVKAASEVHQETKKEDKDKKDKVHKSIEDAINKAMKAEKEVIYLQR